MVLPLPLQTLPVRAAPDRYALPVSTCPVYGAGQGQGHGAGAGAGEVEDVIIRRVLTKKKESGSDTFTNHAIYIFAKHEKDA